MADKKWELLAQRIVHTGAKRRYNLDELKKEFVAFVKYYMDNPTVYNLRTKQHKKGGHKKDVEEVDLSGERVERTAPMTEYAFCLWLGMSKSWFPQMIAGLRDMKTQTEEDREYLDFLLKVQTFLHSQVLEGAVLGEYNGQLVSSLLGMRNNIDVTSDGKPTAAPVISIMEDTKTREDYDASKD